MKLLYYAPSQFRYLTISLLIIVFFSIILNHLLKNKSNTIKDIPLMCISVIILIMEVIKIAVSLKQHNILNTLPFHFCSMFLFWFPLSVFTKGKFQHRVRSIAVMGSMYMTIALYVMPMGIIGESHLHMFVDYINFHNFTFHQLVVLYFIYSLISGLYIPSKNDFQYIMYAIIGYGIIAIPGAIITHYNYSNILYSTFPAVDLIRIKYGQITYISLFFITIMTLAFLTSKMYYLTYKQIKKLAPNNDKNKTIRHTL